MDEKESRVSFFCLCPLAHALSYCPDRICWDSHSHVQEEEVDISELIADGDDEESGTEKRDSTAQPATDQTDHDETTDDDLGGKC